MQKEIWKDVVGYDGIYQVSNYGNVKSLTRISKKRYSNNRIVSQPLKEKLLKIHNNTRGYPIVVLSKEYSRTTFTVHSLMAIAFLNHKRCNHVVVVDHINGIRNDNRLTNLQLITQRLNTSKDKSGHSSKYTGVSWDKANKKWISTIWIDGTLVNLGRYYSEKKASEAYNNKLKEIQYGKQETKKRIE